MAEQQGVVGLVGAFRLDTIAAPAFFNDDDDTSSRARSEGEGVGSGRPVI